VDLFGLQNLIISMKAPRSVSAAFGAFSAPNDWSSSV
jgi:hypothetical protein